MGLLDEILVKLDALPPAQLAALVEKRKADPRLWLPNPGGQTLALQTLADELFYGGQPGGGKSALLIGAAITEHQNSIVFRREFPQIKGLVDEVQRVLGTRDGYNSQEKLWRLPVPGNRTLEFGSVPHENDKESYQGRAHDLKGFDEITHFTRSQYRYLTIWLRSTNAKQRCRIIATGNPPTSPEGMWVVDHWRPWLDETYHDPAKPGELRWAVPMGEGEEHADKELFFRTVEEAVAHVATFKNPPRDPITGEILKPRSRTFIPGELSENAALARTGYGAVLAYAGKEYSDLTSGKFRSELEDDPWQVIPTRWIKEAQDRWKPRPPDGVPMVAIAADVAQGGSDNTTISWRHDCWFAPLVVIPGVKTPNPSDVSAQVVLHRRNGAVIVIDVGGGYGGGVVERLRVDNSLPVTAFNGAHAGMGRTKDRMHAFFNKRAMAWWRFREALDPDQPGGSAICLPNDPALRADLAAPRYQITPRGILLEEKAEIKKRIGRSPDRGDAVVMVWSEGQTALRRQLQGALPGGGSSVDRPKFANVGYAAFKRRNR
jgi:hypothetical protein